MMTLLSQRRGTEFGNAIEDPIAMLLSHITGKQAGDLNPAGGGETVLADVVKYNTGNAVSFEYDDGYGAAKDTLYSVKASQTFLGIHQENVITKIKKLIPDIYDNPRDKENSFKKISCRLGGILIGGRLNQDTNSGGGFFDYQ